MVKHKEKESKCWKGRGVEGVCGEVDIKNKKYGQGIGYFLEPRAPFSL
jgi:hypothetical protein